MAFSENLSVFFTDFAETVTVSGSSFLAIFDNAYVDALGVAGTRPALTCKTSDVSGVVFDAAATVRTISYKVVGIEPDGTGITVLLLERQ